MLGLHAIQIRRLLGLTCVTLNENRGRKSEKRLPLVGNHAEVLHKKLRVSFRGSAENAKRISVLNRHLNGMHKSGLSRRRMNEPFHGHDVHVRDVRGRELVYGEHVQKCARGGNVP